MSKAQTFWTAWFAVWCVIVAVVRFTWGSHMTDPEFLISYWWMCAWLIPGAATAWVLRR